MGSIRQTRSTRLGHTLMELVVAMTAGSFLLAGMGSIMFIARQIAYTPTDAVRRAQSADVVAQICDELRYATLITQQTSKVLEFIVADRNGDGTAEKIRYEWSGTAGDPLTKSVNGGTPVNVATSINAFGITLLLTQKTSTLTTTADSTEALLATNSVVSSALYRDIDTSNCVAQLITPTSFSSIPTNVISWNATRVDFYGQKNGTATETLAIQVRPSGDPYDTPTSSVSGQVTLAESSMVTGWNSVPFSTQVRGLSFSRRYDLVFTQASGTGKAALLAYNDNKATNVNDSTDGGASWQYMSARQVFYRLYGTYTTPSTSYNVTRTYVSDVRIALQSGSSSYSRIDASAPLRNSPELLLQYWRTDFDRDPTATNTNGDSVSDWAVTGGGTFDTTKLSSGVWNATGAIETRPLADFTTTTTVEVRCRNTTTGGNGAVMGINVDRQGGQYAPILVYLQKQTDGSQTLILSGRTSDTATKQLFSRSKLSSGFVRYRLTILPNNNLVNLQINGEDQGTFTYPTYTPTSTTDRYLTLYANTSSADFDYVDLRVGTN